jgi:arsenite methyltransferase
MPNENEIQKGLRKKYAEISRSAAGQFSYPTGRAGAETLHYDPSFVENIPDELLESFCGVGNPFALGMINPGEVLLDIGCGAGFDMIVASRLVGPTGRVCGIDLTPEMKERSQVNFKRAEVSNAEIQIAGSEKIPYDDGTFDVVISNGVLNLSMEKEKSFREIYRVLKIDGRLQFADIILLEEHANKTSCNINDWSD